MTEMQDNELDDLFRKSIADPEIPFDEAAWKSMEAKLDAEDRKRGAYFNRIGAGVVVLMILVGVGLFYSNTKIVEGKISSTNIHTPQSDKQYKRHTGDEITVSKSERIKRTDLSGTEQSANTHDVASVGSNDYKADNNSHRTVSQNDNTYVAVKNSGKTFAEQYAVANKKSRKRNAKYIGEENSNKNNKSINNESINNKSSIIEKASVTGIYGDTNNNNDQHMLDANATQVNSNRSVNDNDKSVATLPADSAALLTSNTKAPMNNPNVGDTFVSERSNDVEQVTVIGTTVLNSINAHSEITTHTNQDASHLNTDADNNVLYGMKKDTIQVVPQGNEANTFLFKNNQIDTAVSLVNIDNTVLNNNDQDSLHAVLPDSVAQKADSLQTTQAYQKTQDTDKKDAYIKGWSLSLLLSPEFNSAADFNFYKPGINVGLNLEYYLHPRISIIAGVMYAQKLYTCDASLYPYSPSYIYHGYNYSPYSVKASCGILDISINIRYKYLNRKTYNLYAVVGLSSYFMLKEKYTFEYSHNHPSDYEEINNENKSLFAIANISAGIEKRINTRWSVQAEPYIKIPFSGIGAGNLKIVSIGMFLSLKYYL
jgi:hypothetical protein